jgi:hypothetical protein
VSPAVNSRQHLSPAQRTPARFLPASQDRLLAWLFSGPMAGKRKASDAKRWASSVEKELAQFGMRRKPAATAQGRGNGKHTTIPRRPSWHCVRPTEGFGRQLKSLGWPGRWCANLLLATCSGSPSKRRSHAHPINRSLLDRGTPPAADMAESTMSVSKRDSRWKGPAATFILTGQAWTAVSGSFAHFSASFASRPNQQAFDLLPQLLTAGREWGAATLYPTFTSFQAAYSARVTKLPPSGSPSFWLHRY